MDNVGRVEPAALEEGGGPTGKMDAKNTLKSRLPSRHATEGAGEEEFFLCKDFIYEIEEYLYPYLRRLVETNHITPEECVEFMDYCYARVLDVAKYLGLETEIPH